MLYIETITGFAKSYEPIIYYFLIDASFSMRPVKSVIIDLIKEIILPAVQGADERSRTVARIAFGAFSGEDVVSLTSKPGFHSFSSLMAMPAIPTNRLYGKGLDGNTALYRTLVHGISSVAMAGHQILNRLHLRQIRTEVICLTDGQNVSADNFSPNSVRNAIRSYQDGPIGLKVCLAYFKTDDTLDRAGFTKIGAQCGIPKENLHFWAESGKTEYEQQRSFRRLMEMVSPH